MGYLLKKPFTKALPANAELSKRNGQTFARWIDGKGKVRTAKVTTGTDGAPRLAVESATYFARYRDAEGRVLEIATGCRSKDAAQAVLNEHMVRAEKIQAGILTPTEARAADWATLPLTEHINAFKRAMTARRLSSGYVKTTEANLKRVFDGCHFRHVTDLTRSGAEHWLSEQVTLNGMGARTHNAHIVALGSFGNWLLRQGRAMSNVFKGMRRINERTDARRPRRPFTVEELTRLFDAAERRPLMEAMTVRRGEHKGEVLAELRPETRARLKSLGRERALIYKVLVLTGLRYGELRSITVAQVVLDASTPHLVLRAADEKARRGAQIVLHEDLVAEIKVHLAERLAALRIEALNQGQPVPAKLPGTMPLFSMPGKMTKVFNADLVFAGIATLNDEKKTIKCDEQGRSVDIHALRHTFGTFMGKAGVPLQLAQRAMRHSDPKLTANLYTHLGLVDVAGAVAALPSIPRVEDTSANEGRISVNEKPNACTSLALPLALISGNACDFVTNDGKKPPHSYTDNVHTQKARNGSNDRVFQGVARVAARKEWRARRDSNSRPLAPEASALSN